MFNESLEDRVMSSKHTLIAGATGAGKSVLINTALCYAYKKFPNKFMAVYIDLKRVELREYKNTRQCVYYASDADDAIYALQLVENVIETRFQTMEKRGLRQSLESHLYVIIDELADLMLSVGKQAKPLLQRISQLGRAVNVHLICATQCPLASVIPTAIKVNFDCIIGLRTRCKQDSRNIIGVAGCETLPLYGQCYMQVPDIRNPLRMEIKKTPDSKIKEICTLNKKKGLLK